MPDSYQAVGSTQVDSDNHQSAPFPWRSCMNLIVLEPQDESHCKGMEFNDRFLPKTFGC